MVSLLPVAQAAQGRQDLSTPEATARAYVKAASEGDVEALLNTITFPETQFYLDGRTWTRNSADEYDQELDYPFVLQVDESSILDSNASLALVRVVLKRTNRDGQSIRFVAWWGMRKVENEWRIAWRQVVGDPR